ncbi:MAG: alkaline phosphatase family protein [Gemmatimonadetes bacterium]|nr:alkaline phosphatase family protein [Gemmatimonadota bacterium]
MRRLCTLGLALGLLAGCSRGPEPPRLVVVVVVDQMRADYLDRFGPAATGGLRRILDQGTVFRQARFAHAMTGTAPGHATLVTGADPRVHGIFEKEWLDPSTWELSECTRDPSTRVLGPGEPTPGESPRLLMASTLGDWLRKAREDSRVFSVALKPRAAVLMGGHRANAAYWFSRQRLLFTSSTYYLPELPAWVREFNETEVPRFRGRSWEPIGPLEAYEDSREDDFAGEYDGINTGFPHDFHVEPGDDPVRAYANALSYSPFGDDLTIRFARWLTQRESLGQDDTPDLLFLGASSADFVGHLYGPWSQEVRDYYLHLDAYLERGFTWLDSYVGEGRYVLVLTSDHGVAMLPEEARRRGLSAERVRHEEYREDMTWAGETVQEALGLPRSPIRGVSHEGLYLDYRALAVAGVSLEQLERELEATLLQLPYVERVFTRDVLRAEPDGSDPLLDSFRRSYVDGRAPHVMMLHTSHWVVDTFPGGTDHGTPYAYDTHVPLAIVGPGWEARSVDEPVDMVDLAPTLAAQLGVAPAETARGRDLRKLVR